MANWTTRGAAATRKVRRWRPGEAEPASSAHARVCVAAPSCPSPDTVIVNYLPPTLAEAEFHVCWGCGRRACVCAPPPWPRTCHAPSPTQGLFAPFGDVLDAKIVRNHRDGRSLGFGFVSYVTEESAHSAVANMNGYEVRGTILVDVCGFSRRAPAAGLPPPPPRHHTVAAVVRISFATRPHPCLRALARVCPSPAASQARD